MRAKTISKTISAALSAAMLVTSLPAAALAAPAASPKAADGEQNLLKLWYDEPASQGVNILSAGSYHPSEEDNNWQQHTLPIGNSFMGANVYGEIAKERLTFNQKTLWNGGPSTRRPDYDGGNIDKADVWQETVSAFLNGDDATGSSLAGGLVGEGESGGYGVYQSWGDIYLDYKDLANVTETTDYERNLDLTTGIANVDFEAGGTTYHREYFISYPDNVLAMKLTADGAKTLNLNVSFPIDNGENESEANSLKNANLGKTDVQYDVDAQSGTIVNKATMQDNQMKMNSVLNVVTDKGTIAEGSDNQSLDISGAEEVTIFISANTDYKNVYPKYRTGETDQQLADRVKQTVDDAVGKGYEEVKSRYLSDYQGLFGRVDLDLGQAISDKTTDQLLAAYKSSMATESERRLLEVILYQYGRYLTIASSRDGDLPSNLQGVWQNRVGNSDKVPWGSDFHMNVNLQMNYWPTYSANLAECAIPIIDYVNSLREPGRVTAEKYFGIKSEAGKANGFSAHTQNSPFGWTCPGWSFNWGWSPAAVPWILQNCWEHYEYTGDLEYMRTHLYPMMKEETLLYDQILVDSGRKITLEDGTKSTRLVSAPAYSSEHGPRTLGNVYENVLIWQLYEDTITAAELLGVDSDLVARWKEIKERLSPIEIGDSGQIKEWYNEGEYGKTETGENISGFESGHRHMSHMLGLFPGDLVSVENEDYINAAVTTLDKRGYSSTGWGMGQRINAWARTGNGNTTYRLVQNLFRDGIYPNLWDAHAPFQIDGNFGYTSGINEMLMQSNMGYINILPAIPDVWSDGSVNGIVARGNFELGIDWANGTATEVRILSKNGGECIVQCQGIATATITDSKGAVVTSVPVEGKDNRIKFNTVKGETYTIQNMTGAPQNCKAVKGDNGVVLTWDAVQGANSYNVYSKSKSVLAKISTDGSVTGTTFTDTKKYSDINKVEYFVSAVINGREGSRSAPFKIRSKIELIDDSDARISYTGDWGNWGDAGHYGGNIKFIETTAGTESIELTFEGTGIEVIAPKNTTDARWHNWPVTIDGGSAETSNYVGNSSAKKQVVYSNYDLSEGEHTIKIDINEEGKKIEFDAFFVYSEKDPDITVTYDPDKEGVSAPAETKGKFRETVTLSDFNEKGFRGWSDGTTLYKAGSEYTLSYEDVTLTAVYRSEADIEINTTDEYILTVPKSWWAATAGSEQNSGNDGPADYAIDGNEGTWWHSNYSNDSKKPSFGEDGTRNEFTIDFGDSVSVDKFEYVPRSNDNANGFISKYQILTSDSEDGAFTKVAEGEWSDIATNRTKRTVTFDNTLTNVRRIQIKALETKNGPGGQTQGNQFIHAVEFNVYKKNPNYTEPGPTVLPNEITVTSEAITLERGAIVDLGAAITPDDATDKSLLYTSSDIMVASVSPNGIVTASKYKSGTATITIKSSAVTTLTKTVSVIVKDPEVVEVASIKLEKERIVLKVGEETTLAASIEPYFGTDKTITWTSSDDAVVSVTDGLIEAHAVGDATITATTVNGKTATCEVKVSEQSEAVNRKELSSAIMQFETQYNNLGQYTEESVEAYNQALQEAKKLLGYGDNAVQSEIDAALQALRDAAEGLMPKGSGGETPDKTALQNAINVARLIDTSRYTDESVRAFNQALEDAEGIYSKPDATQTEINNAKNALDDAQKKLKPKPTVVEPDKTELTNAITSFRTEYESKADQYSDAVKDAFDNAIAAAQEVANKSDATAQEIADAVTALGTAGTDLGALISQEETIGKGGLKTEIVNIKAEYAGLISQYSEAVKTKYNEAIADAEAALNDPNADKTAVDSALSNLRAAVTALDALINEEDAGKKVDTSELQQKLGEFKAKYTETELAKYSDTVRQAFNDAVKAVEDILKKENPTVREVNKALGDLVTADTNLTTQINQEKEADKPAFKSEIDAFKEKYPDLSGYSKEIQDAFNQAVAEAEAVLNDNLANKAAVEAALKKLKNAGAALNTMIEEADKKDSVDKEALKTEINAAKKKSLTTYTPNSQTAYRNAIAEAQKVYDNADATQTQVDQAVRDLKAAAGKLVPKANFTALNAAIAAAARKSLTGYTQASVIAFNAKLSAARVVANNQNSTQAQVNTALRNLQTAQNGLVKAVPGMGETIVQGDFEYKVTKSDANSGTVKVSKLTSAGKKKATLKILPTITENGYTFNVTEIDKNVFQKNKKLKSVEIGANVTKIGNKCFFNCKNLKTVTFKNAKVPKIGKQAFKGIKSKPTINYSSKMKKNVLKKFQSAMKKAGVSKASYKKKK